MKNQTFLGIDLGTSAVKVNWIDQAGRLLGESECGYETLQRQPGFFEQKPADWLAAIGRAVRDLGPGPAESVAAIGLSAQMPTLVLLEKDGTVAGDAILWCDSRAEGEAAEFLQKAGQEEHFQKTGVVLDGRYLIPMYLWVRAHEPTRLLRRPTVLSAKDYLCYSLCGRARTDPSTASGFGVYNLKTNLWDQALLDLAQVDSGCLPEIRSSLDDTDRLLPAMADKLGLPAGIPVCCGAADSVAGVFGVSGGEDGTLVGLYGSGLALIAPAPDTVFVQNEPAPAGRDRYFITPLIDDPVSGQSRRGFEADILSAGSTLRWLIDLFNFAALAGFRRTGAEDSMTFARLFQLVDSVEPGAAGLVCTPYLLGGEQGVLWDPALSGSILGLTTAHHFGHIARAGLEGLAFEVRRCLTAFNRGGAEINRVLLTGAIAEQPVFLQLLADVLGLPCAGSDRRNGSAYGAAAIARVSLLRRCRQAESAVADNGSADPPGFTLYQPRTAISQEYNRYYDRYVRTAAHSRIRV